MRRCDRSFVLVALLVAAFFVSRGATPAHAVFFDLHGLTPNQSLGYSLTLGGITAQVGGTGFLMKSGATTFGIDATSANDNPMLIDGGGGFAENFSFLFNPTVVFDSLLISQFDSVDSGRFDIKSGQQIALTNGVTDVGILAASSANYLRWTGDSVSGMSRGFSVDGFTVRLVGDYNGDGAIDAGDYIVWRKLLGSSVATRYRGADGDGDGTIGPGDYAVWRTRYVRPPGSGTQVLAVPEPASVVIIATACAALMTWQRVGSNGRR
jgi:hypothetical protein